LSDDSNILNKSLSLKRRALLFLTPFFLLFFIVLAYILQSSVERSLIASTEQQLTLQIRLLLADIDVDSDGVMQMVAVEEARLKQPNSDLQAFIYDKRSSTLLWESPSAEYLTLPVLAENSVDRLIKESRLGEAQFERLGSGFALSFTVAFEMQSVVIDNVLETVTMVDAEQTSISEPYTLIIFDSGKSYKMQLVTFQRTLVSGLVLALLVFLGLQYCLLRWLFRPLGQIEQELNEIERGAQLHFEKKYPAELAPLTYRLNQFMDVERLQRERYKNTLGDLAHSIKTPLAVIRSIPDIATKDAGAAVTEQVERMEQIVSHQLRRSAMPALDGGIYRADATAIIRRILESLQKLYRDKSIRLVNQLPDQLLLRIPEDDLFELMGNLLDNAFKYGESLVTIELAPQSTSTSTIGNEERFCTIQIKNDGVAISQARALEATQRGVRLDESDEGQGIGLSVARAIIRAYRGELSILPEPDNRADEALSQSQQRYTVVLVRLPMV